jgi:TetR/AcrR family transcriptional repressor of nem operon
MPTSNGNTLQLLLDVAEEMVQTRGYNAVSFRDLAARVNIKTASIHYYFPTKGELGVALAERYRERFTALRREIAAARAPAPDKLRRYVKALADGFRANGRMCLCGVLAAESSTLPREVVQQVQGFFEENEAWLATILDAGRAEGTLRFNGPPAVVAKSIFASLEGALMAAWTFNDEKRLAAAGKWLVDGLGS